MNDDDEDTTQSCFFSRPTEREKERKKERDRQTERERERHWEIRETYHPATDLQCPFWYWKHPVQPLPCRLQHLHQLQ